MSEIRVGTSAFTTAGWEGAFYPADMKPADYLTYYATKFDTVEVDSTFYHAPSTATVMGWACKTPDNFVFALKVPQVITHEKVLVDCDEEFRSFVSTAELLGPHSAQCCSSSVILIARSSRRRHSLWRA
jgi:uncharacterized protein YecE (DUF72 family)